MDDDYWSLDSIYTQTQKLDCTFLTNVPNLGHLDGGEEQDIASQTKMQLPYWLAAPLLINGHAELRIPHPFSLRVRKALGADPRSVKLSQLVGTGGSWYSFDLQIGDLLEDKQSREPAEVLEKAFRTRIVDIVGQAQHFRYGSGIGGSSAAGNEFREGLESTERDLFLLVQRNAHQAQEWAEGTDKR